jgi:hypothetical protein
LSEADADAEMVPETVDPAVGAVTEVVGGVVSAADAVVAFTLADCALLFPAASKAETAYAYVVAGERPESVNDADERVPTWTPFLKTLYPVTPTLSVEAVQERDAVDVAVPDTERPEGTEGAVVSLPPPPPAEAVPKAASHAMNEPLEVPVKA